MNVWLAEIWRAWRASVRRPGFLLLASGVLALGVGSTVAVFTLIDHVLLKPLPYAHPAQLVSIGPTARGHGRRVTAQEYQHLMGLPGIASLGVYTGMPQPANITGGGKPVVVTVRAAGHRLLPTLGVSMALGRNFTAQEDRPNGARVAILSYRFWQRRFAGNVHVLGKGLPINGRTYTIVGVLPAGFKLGQRADLLLPTALTPHSSATSNLYIAVARMASNTHARALSAEVNTRLHAMYAAIGTGDTAARARMHFNAMDLGATLHSTDRSLLTAFMAVALFVLLVALFNLVNLMLLRALARTHETAIRAALGASAVRRAGPSLAEGLLIGLIGAVAGVGLAALGLMLVGGFMPPDWLGGAVALHFGMGIWGFALAVGIGVASFASALAVWRSRGVRGVDELREGGRSGATRGGSRLSKVLVVAQVTLATLLICGVGAFLQLSYQIGHASLGFSSSHVLTFRLAPASAIYPTAKTRGELARRVLRSLRAQPGIMTATASTMLPAGHFMMGTNFQVGGGSANNAMYVATSPDYFATYRIPLRAGRTFKRTDMRGGERVAIVNEAFARKYFGATGKAIGKSLGQVGAVKGSVRIIGVVGNTRGFGIGPWIPMLYLPLSQLKMPQVLYFAVRVRVRVRGALAGYRKSMAAAVFAVAPQQPVDHIRSSWQLVHRDISKIYRVTTMIGGFALLALLLAAAGLYAMIGAAVATREHELGVRVALGATPARLFRWVMRRGLVQIGIGLAVGVLLGWALVQVMRSTATSGVQLHLAPWYVGGACVVLIVAGIAACIVPALRAAHIAPMRLLRGE